MVSSWILDNFAKKTLICKRKTTIINNSGEKKKVVEERLSLKVRGFISLSDLHKATISYAELAGSAILVSSTGMAINLQQEK